MVLRWHFSAVARSGRTRAARGNRRTSVPRCAASFWGRRVRPV